MGQFASDTAVEKVAENKWRSEFKYGWRIGQTMNGGYVLAVITRVLREALPHTDPLSINAFYMAPSQLGPCEIDVEVLKTGRGTSFGSASLYQNGELKVRATAAFTDLHNLEGETWLGSQPPSVRPFDEVANLSASHLEIHERIDMRLVEGYEVFEKGITPGTGEFIAWLQHRDKAPFDSIDLTMLSDILPPPPFSLFGPFGWVPTIELTVQCRAVPVPGPILGRLKSRHLTSSIIESDADLWDCEGNLVALARQTMKVRLPSNA